MTVAELYAQIGGDYEEALSRLSMDMLVERFIVKLLDDTSCRDLCAAWEAGDEAAAFKAAHAAKGVYANLALADLTRLASAITEALREGNEDLRATTDVDALVGELSAKYAKVTAAIEAFAAQG